MQIMATSPDFGGWFTAGSGSRRREPLRKMQGDGETQAERKFQLVGGFGWLAFYEG
jgi:hypothetical protein